MCDILLTRIVCSGYLLHAFEDSGETSDVSDYTVRLLFFRIYTVFFIVSYLGRCLELKWTLVHNLLEAQSWKTATVESDLLKLSFRSLVITPLEEAVVSLIILEFFRGT